MAGDWIKMRVGLTAHPRVRRMAERLLRDAGFLAWSGLSGEGADRHAALRVTRYVTVTALLRFWGYANEHAKGEIIDGVWPEDVDDVTGVPGFGDAIEAAGWVVFDRENGVLTMPNFEEHNVSATERGSTSAERQRRYRERKKNEGKGASCDATRNVTSDVTVTHREEKRREENTVESNPLGASAPGGAVLEPREDVPRVAEQTELIEIAPVPKREKPADEDFERAWALYPKRDGGNPKKDALNAWNARRRDGVSADIMITGVERYAAHMKAKGKIGTEFVMQAVRFFGPSKQYAEPWPVAQAQGVAGSMMRPNSSDYSSSAAAAARTMQQHNIQIDGDLSF